MHLENDEEGKILSERNFHIFLHILNSMKCDDRILN